MPSHLDSLVTIGFNIKACRQKLEMSQEDLSNQAEITREYLSKIENAKLDNISFKILYNLSSALKVSVEDLLKS